MSYYGQSERMHSPNERSHPSSLYEAVANDDIEGMVLLYAELGRNSIHSYLSLKRRWGMIRRMTTSGSTNRSYRGGASEEKLDEFFQPSSRQFSDLPRSSITEAPSDELGSPYSAATLHKLDAILQRSDTKPKTDDTIEAKFDYGDPPQSRFASESRHSVLPNVRREVLQDLIPSPWTRRHPHLQRDRCHKLMSAATMETDKDEIERVLQESAVMLSNTRPCQSFVVPYRVAVALRKTKNLTHLNDDNAMLINDDDGQEREEEPPLFDGSVANATPGGGPLTAGGGSGTALHLACALDSPLALVLMLVMGADADSRHTAFRRLMVHEAACANSPVCLQLLLELGRDYSEKDASRLGVCSSATRDREMTQSVYGHSFFAWNKKKGPVADTSDKTEHNTMAVVKAGIDTKCEASLGFVSILELVLDLIRRVKIGELLEIDAALQLLTCVPLSEGNKKAISASCAPVPVSESKRIPSIFAAALPSAMHNHIAPSSNADGHGNTALHWAAFKNSAACVSVLLSHQADPNARAEPSGWTPLHDAAYSDAAESVSLLVRAGADVDARANSGATPLCFSAQEDAPNTARLLLEAGADSSVRCCGQGQASPNELQGGNGTNNNAHHSRFSGYTPLHYCAHYNAHRAARVLLDYDSEAKSSSKLLEIADLNEKLPIHVAVVRGSCDVLRELLHGGARVDTSNMHSSHDDQSISPTLPSLLLAPGENAAVSARAPIPPRTPPRQNSLRIEGGAASSPLIVTPVSSPILRSLIPVRPITSTKPWNCLTQRAIDECRALIREVELHWAPERHSLFHPTDRRAVMELLRVGKRLEQMDTGIFLELWPHVLSFCGRGWFEPGDTCLREDDGKDGRKVGDTDAFVAGHAVKEDAAEDERAVPLERHLSISDDDNEFTQFCLDV